MAKPWKVQSIIFLHFTCYFSGGDVLWITAVCEISSLTDYKPIYCSIYLSLWILLEVAAGRAMGRWLFFVADEICVCDQEGKKARHHMMYVDDSIRNTDLMLFSDLSRWMGWLLLIWYSSLRGEEEASIFKCTLWWQEPSWRPSRLIWWCNGVWSCGEGICVKTSVDSSSSFPLFALIFIWISS